MQNPGVLHQRKAFFHRLADSWMAQHCYLELQWKEMWIQCQQEIYRDAWWIRQENGTATRCKQKTVIYRYQQPVGNFHQKNSGTKGSSKQYRHNAAVIPVAKLPSKSSRENMTSLWLCEKFVNSNRIADACTAAATSAFTLSLSSYKNTKQESEKEPKQATRGMESKPWNPMALVQNVFFLRSLSRMLAYLYCIIVPFATNFTETAGSKLTNSSAIYW